ncbi:hypothetical protein GGR25_001674 [Kaistia hirudinis]|uniref:Glycosyltransferase RgtA/B/C/D-like domain-containing protein n=1 Tax=Kaistia hirudinis TaxID=1293440 RepID=A0A840AQ71_9HYPH|nr:hypothetical protein [Kaistia hirudinis]MBB3930635.1 hypothetical protein [Kaistia hirudinis]
MTGSRPPEERRINVKLTKPTLKTALVVLPFLVTLIFIWRFATPTPLTDEWILVYNAMVAQHASFKNILAIIGALGWKINDHPLIVPNLIYLTIAPVFGFDARAMVAITAACFLAVALALARSGLSLVAALLAALILASPAHFMEFQWGFQFTLTLSIWLPVIGLVVLDQGTREGRIDLRSALIFAILAALGVLSSAPAAFSLIAAGALIALKPLPRREKLLAILVLAAAFIAVALVLHAISGGGDQGSPAPVAYYILTAIGGVLFSSPLVLKQFGFDLRSATGLVLVITMLALGLFAAVKGRISALALPAALTLYSVALLGAVAVIRGYLGNWHIQMAVPVLLAAIVLADRAWTAGALPARTGALVIFAIIAFGVVGVWNGFTVEGPAHAQYAQNVTNYMRNIRNAPAEKPFPGNWDVAPEMVDFLKKKGNPSFADEK